MKTFQQFNEDIEELRRELQTLERLAAPRQRLAARRRAALERTRQIHKTERKRQKEYQEKQKEKLQAEQIAEGKKKELVQAYLAGRQQSEPTIVDFGDVGSPNSPERNAAVKELMKRHIGGGAIRRAQKEKKKQAKKVVKSILKHQVTEVTLGPGETYGSSSYQERLEKERKKQEQEKKTQRLKDTNAARRAFRTTGMRVTHRGQPGVIKDGEFIPDT